jgi:hypothetical protein
VVFHVLVYLLLAVPVKSGVETYDVAVEKLVPIRITTGQEVLEFELIMKLVKVMFDLTQVLGVEKLSTGGWLSNRTLKLEVVATLLEALFEAMMSAKLEPGVMVLLRMSTLKV